MLKKCNQEPRSIFWSLSLNTFSSLIIWAPTLLQTPLLLILVLLVICAVSLNLKPYVVDIIVCNNETMYGVSKGNSKDLVGQKDGATSDLTLQESSTYANLWLTHLLWPKQYLQMENYFPAKVKLITSKLEWIRFCSKNKFYHGSDQLQRIEVHPNSKYSTNNSQTLERNKLHTVFGHPYYQGLGATAASYGFHITLLNTCQNFAIAEHIFL
jgi:hypothetical protein